MSTQIIFRRGSNNPTAASGLTLAEPAFNYSNNTLWIGKGTGITAVWVGAGICGSSAGIAAGLTYQIPTLGAVKDYVQGYVGTTSVNYVTSFNGLTGDVGGVTTSVANIFTALQTFNSGISASYVYVSTGSTFASNLQVNGGATFSGRVDVGGNFKVLGDTQLGDQSTDLLTVFAGTTFNNRTDFAGNNNFATGLTAAGNITLTGSRTVIAKGGNLTLKGLANGSPTSSNSIILYSTSTPLQLVSATGIIDTARGFEGLQGPYITGFKVNTDDADVVGTGSSTITPQTYLSGNRFLYIPDDTGTIALTKGVVTSFNGVTGAVGGVTTSAANTFTALQSFSKGVSASGATFGGTTTVSTLNVGAGVYGGLALPDSGTLSVNNISAYSPANLAITGNAGNGVSITDNTSIILDAPTQITIGDYSNSNSYLYYTPNTNTIDLGQGFNQVAIINAASVQSSGNITTTTGNIFASAGYISSPSLGGGNPGVTASARVYTYPDGVTTTSNKSQFYQPTYGIGRDAGGYTVQANRTYFSLFYTPTSKTIKTIRMETESTGSTGAAFFGIYSVDTSTGLPKTRLYTSASTVVAGNYSQTTVSSVNYTVPAGWFYLAVSCSLTPRLYGYAKINLVPVFGSGGNSDGYQNYFPLADTTGHTLPSSLPASGVTLAFVDYSPANYVGVRLEYGV